MAKTTCNFNRLLNTPPQPYMVGGDFLFDAGNLIFAFLMDNSVVTSFWKIILTLRQCIMKTEGNWSFHFYTFHAFLYIKVVYCITHKITSNSNKHGSWFFFFFVWFHVLSIQGKVWIFCFIFKLTIQTALGACVGFWNLDNTPRNI